MRDVSALREMLAKASGALFQEKCRELVHGERRLLFDETAEVKKFLYINPLSGLE
jgi:hypothetical protein